MAYILYDSNSGIILGSIVVDEHTFATGWEPPAGQTLLQVFDADAMPGWIWDGTKAVNPNPPPMAAPMATPATPKVT